MSVGAAGRRAFTLLEVLLAITLTSVVGVAALSLNAMQARVGAAARAEEEALAVATGTVRLLDDDLLLAVPGAERSRFQLEQGRLRLRTSNRLPGEEPGTHDIEWRFDPARGALLRITAAAPGGQPTVRTLGRQWRDCVFSVEQERLWLNGRLGQHGEAWRVPLWTEQP